MHRSHKKPGGQPCIEILKSPGGTIIHRELLKSRVPIIHRNLKKSGGQPGLGREPAAGVVLQLPPPVDPVTRDDLVKTPAASGKGHGFAAAQVAVDEEQNFRRKI
jgi:hypothetical protein